MILTGGDAYQTVTIVPSETNPGEVSYVLIVQQPDEEKDKEDGEDHDLTVYDFDEAEEPGPVSGAVCNTLFKFYINITFNPISVKM